MKEDSEVKEDGEKVEIFALVAPLTRRVGLGGEQDVQFGDREWNDGWEEGETQIRGGEGIGTRLEGEAVFACR